MPRVQCICGQSIRYESTPTKPVRCPSCQAVLSFEEPAADHRSDAEAMKPGQLVRGGDAFRSWLSLTMLLGTAVCLTPAWWKQIYLGPMMSEDRMGFLNYYRAEIVGAVVSPYLPVALGLLLSVRARALNLSVWAMVSLGSVIAWAMVSFDAPLPLAVALAMTVGGVLGGAESAVAGRWNLPAAAVTAVGGAVVLAVSRLLAHGMGLQALPPQSLGILEGSDARMLFSLALYAVPMLSMLDRGGWSQRQLSKVLRQSRALALGSGLAAGGGVIVLLASSGYVSKALLVGDWRVISSVMLCGALVWKGEHGTQLAGALLPVGMYVSTLWMEMVHLPWAPSWLPVDLPLIVLTLMAMSVQWLVRGWLGALVIVACWALILGGAYAAWSAVGETLQTVGISGAMFTTGVFAWRWFAGRASSSAEPNAAPAASGA